MIVINGLAGHIIFFWYVVLRLLSVHMCVSSVNIYSLLHIKLYANQQERTRMSVTQPQPGGHSEWGKGGCL